MDWNSNSLGKSKLLCTSKNNLAGTLDRLATKGLTVESTEEEIYDWWLNNGMCKTKSKQRKFSEGIMHLLFEKQQKIIEEQQNKIERLHVFITWLATTMDMKGT